MSAEKRNKILEAGPLGVRAVQRRGTVVDGRTRNEIPVPGCGDVLVLIALEVGVQCTVGQVEA